MKFSFGWKYILLGIFTAALVVGVSCKKNNVYLDPAVSPKPVAKVKGTVRFSAMVDILFVIDNSYSMNKYQAKLQQNIDLFLAEIEKSEGIDYHIGVVTTSAEDQRARTSGVSGNLVSYKGKGITFVDRMTDNGLLILRQLLNVGVLGSGNEMIFDPIFLALSEPALSTTNRNFYRSQAYLTTIFLTDAEDQSVLVPDPAVLFAFLKKIKKNDPTKLISYGAVIPSAMHERPNCIRDQMGRKPLKIEKYFKLMNSAFNKQWFDICTADYGPQLGAVGRNLVQRVSKYIYLDQIPEIDTLRVFFKTEEISNDAGKGWTFDPSRNAVVLSDNLDWEKISGGEPGSLTVDFTPSDSF